MTNQPYEVEHVSPVQRHVLNRTAFHHLTEVGLLEVMRYLEWSWDFDLPSWRPKVLPGPEPPTITDASAFQSARTSLARLLFC